MWFAVHGAVAVAAGAALVLVAAPVVAPMFGRELHNPTAHPGAPFAWLLGSIGWLAFAYFERRPPLRTLALGLCWGAGLLALLKL